MIHSLLSLLLSSIFSPKLSLFLYTLSDPSFYSYTGLNNDADAASVGSRDSEGANIDMMGNEADVSIHNTYDDTSPFII